MLSETLLPKAFGERNYYICWLTVSSVEHKQTKTNITFSFCNSDGSTKAVNRKSIFEAKYLATGHFGFVDLPRR